MLMPTMAMAMLPSTEASTLELLVTPPEPPMLPDLPRELARGLLMLMPTMAILPSTPELLPTQLEPLLLPGLPRVLEERGLLMLMLTMAILMPMDKDTLIPMDTELMDSLMVMPDGK